MVVAPLAPQPLLCHLQPNLFLLFVDLPSVTTIYHRPSTDDIVDFHLYQSLLVAHGVTALSFFGLRGGGFIMALDANPSRQGVSGTRRQRLLGGLELFSHCSPGYQGDFAKSIVGGALTFCHRVEKSMHV